MFVGRTAEMAALEQHFNTGRFEMAVVYGRRRVGKTFLLSEFARGKRAFFFTAFEKSDDINLSRFSEAALAFFGMPDLARFTTWEAALRFVAAQAAASTEPLLVIFDELPYAAKANPALPSILQTVIDHDFRGTNSLLVLCGSNQGFMESEVLGEESPLYGRRTIQMKLEPFDFFDARAMLAGFSAEEQVHFYAAFGGTPYYLAQINPALGFRENIAHIFLEPYGVLFAEPEMLLRQELRDIALYQSVLDAIGAGRTTPKEIAELAGVGQNSVGKYLTTLAGLGIVRRDVPFGANPARSKHGLWRMADPFFAFWWRFVSPYLGAIERHAGEAVLHNALTDEALETYTGGVFEKLCLQWLTRQGAAGELGFLATYFGSWWGADPVAREQADVDVVVADARGENLLVGECKWRNSFDETAAIALLEQRAAAFAGKPRTRYLLFSKRPVSPATQVKAAARDDLQIVTLAHMLDTCGSPSSAR